MDTSLEWDKRRVLLVGDVNAQSELSVRLGVTQLAGPLAPRLEQAARVSELGEDDFSIVAGDMRDLPGSETLGELTQSGLFDAWKAVRDEDQPTHKAGRVDHVLPGVDGIPDPDAPGRMPVVYARVPATRGLSDHRPVVAYFQRPRGGEAKEAVGDACASPCAVDADCQDSACGFGRCVEGLCAECLSDAECVGELGYEPGSACDAVTRWCF